MGIMNFAIKAVFYFALSIFGIGIVDIAISLQRQTIKAYQKGPISAGQFTRMMTEEPKKK